MTPQYLSPIVYDGTILESRRLDPANLPWTPAPLHPPSHLRRIARYLTALALLLWTSLLSKHHASKARR